MAATWETLTVDDGEMRAYMALPAGGRTSPGVVVTHYAGGVDPFIQSVVERLADGGVAAIAPDLYYREEAEPAENAMARMRRLPTDLIARAMAVAREHLGSHTAVSAEGIGITGFGAGARIAYLTAATDREYRAAVVFYAGEMAVPWGGGPAPLAETSRIACPVLGLFGEDDDDPSPEHVRELDGEMTRHGVVHEFHSYPGAPHGFMSPGRPIYRPEAAQDAWQKALAWFRRHLG